MLMIFSCTKYYIDIYKEPYPLMVLPEGLYPHLWTCNRLKLKG